jgi:hypothetical protein
MTESRSLEQTLLGNLPQNKARIKFVARILSALYAILNLDIHPTRLQSCPANYSHHSEAFI